MVTPEEIQSLALFAALNRDLCERIARVAADVSLVDGEYVVHEGDVPALFAVLDGRMEAVKMVDGEERVIGERFPGQVFGEVSLTLGTSHPAGLRAAGKARVIRIEQRDYHELAAVAPGIATEVGALAWNRIGGPRGLQGLAAEAPPARAVVVPTAGTLPAPSCGGFSPATRSRSAGSFPMRQAPRTTGAARCRTRTTARRCA